MSKRIVFCADGIWDSAQWETNVSKLSKSIRRFPGQVVLYDNGAVNGTPIQELRGGAFGIGLFQKIKEAYSQIAHEYEPGDGLFLFGGSRGALTARSVAAMIAVCGLPTQPFDNEMVDTAFSAYRDKNERAGLLAGLGRYGLLDAQITMLGVWDTVGSLGIPGLIGQVDHLLYGFLDTTLHPDVQNGFQALSIDDRRQEFPPTLWTMQPAAGQTVEQVWFAGDHHDVCGGYPEGGLSHITWNWIAAKAAALGLQIDVPGLGLTEQKWALDKLHDSWTTIWGTPKLRNIGANSTVANSVRVRSAFDSTYRPANLMLTNGAPSASYRVEIVVAEEGPVSAANQSPAGDRRPVSLSYGQELGPGDTVILNLNGTFDGDGVATWTASFLVPDPPSPDPVNLVVEIDPEYSAQAESTAASSLDAFQKTQVEFAAAAVRNPTLIYELKKEAVQQIIAVRKMPDSATTPPRRTRARKATGASPEAAPSEAASTPEVPFAIKFHSTYAAFEGDLVSFDQQSFKEPLTDSLGADVYAGHLAQLIVARRTPLPLSLGLFGDWGAGKSYFMRLLHRQIDSLTGRTDDVFCRKVVQIHFNAWHYLDTNLWANLVSEIFDNLFKALIDRRDTPNDRVEALKKKLAEESALAAEAKKALEDAKKTRTAAETKLSKATQERREKEESVAQFIDDLANVVIGDDDLKKKLQFLAESFGLNQLKTSFSELEARAMEARSLGGRFRTLALTLLSPEGRTQRLGLLFAALVVPAVVASMVPWLLKMKDAQLASFTRSVTAAVTLIGALATWISEQTKTGSALIGKMEKAYYQVRKAREKARLEPASGQAELEKKIREESEASQALSEAQARVRSIEAELHDLTPGRRLLQFLEQRAAANDYRQYLGLVSLVRRDFEQLSHLLQDGREAKPPVEPLLDRIVLYIDDLDRCKSDRVVAVLEAVHLLLAFPIFAVVVAVDPRWLRRSLVEHYPTLLTNGRAADGEVPLDRESLASPQDYLEKIFQVPFQLQPMERTGFSMLVTQLLPLSTPTPAVASPPAPESEPRIADTKSDPAAENPVLERSAGAIVGPAKVEPSKQRETLSPAPASPERLQLQEWEQGAVKECHPLFRTPRAVKRLANTYCLIRVGVEETVWPQFLRTEYRTPLLMLAVAAAYPGLAGRWLDGLEKNGAWIPVTDAATLPDGDRVQWDQLMGALKQMNADNFASFDAGQVRNWLPKVKRYSF